MWRNVLQRVDADLTKFDFDRIAANKISGREVNAVCRLGLALAAHRGEPFNQKILDDALIIAGEFRKDFPQTEW